MWYKVTLRHSGRSFNVNDDESVLDAALRHGLNLPYGCRNGTCGTCKTKVNDGRVHYPRQQPDALTPEEQEHSMALLCQAYPQSDLIIDGYEIDAVKDIPVRTMPCRVESIEQLNHDVLRIMLKLPPAIRLQYLAGQYIDFLLKDGRRRSFSIANAPHDDGYIELHVRHIQGGRFTSALFDNVKVNDILRIEGPLGNFFLREGSDRPVIFLAGGTGFAPIKGIIEHTLAAGIRRPLHLYWGARAREDLYMHDLACKWADENSHIHYTPVLSDPTPADHWQGRTGFVHEAVMQDMDSLVGFEVYASGPPAMVYAGRDAFTPLGLSTENYFSDAFEFAND
jgi:CDP-4-dehydro-6-deoxyglucose reductase